MEYLTAIQNAIKQYGIDDRIYSLQVREDGGWAIKITSTDGTWISSIGSMY